MFIFIQLVFTIVELTMQHQNSKDKLLQIVVHVQTLSSEQSDPGVGIFYAAARGLTRGRMSVPEGDNEEKKRIDRPPGTPRPYYNSFPRLSVENGALNPPYLLGQNDPAPSV